MKVDTLLAIGGFILALGGNITWAIIMIANAQKKAYAAERDFNHLKNNQKDISDGIAMGFDEIERRFDYVDKELIELKSWLIRGFPTNQNHQ
ncbi:hypothetical protein [Nostoc sp. MS1]|uniref:hypothetical protein n=1 Tax=Nostoc sp. MS1 TaxID=2764711 RepID=UPI001CC59106|nr:hypothetical protein [Nostoc sp. MS1]BCL34251.1 hypothetical protein NSMS1_06980 [Nostoc sp. MS1]